MSDIEIRYDGKTYDIDEFELGDLEWLEEFLGAPLSDLDSLNSMKAAVGFVYIIRRQDDPDFTIEQARKTKLGALAQVADADGKAGKRPPKRAAR